MDIKAVVLSARQQLVQSKTFKAIVAGEVLAISVFIQGVLSGTQGLTFNDLKGWALIQFAMVIVVCMRDTWAGIEAKLDGAVDPKILQAAADGAKTAIVKKLEQDHPAAADAIKAQLIK